MNRLYSLFATVVAAIAVPAVGQQPEPQPLPAELPALALIQRIDPRAMPAARLESLSQALSMLVQPTPLRGAVLCERAATYEVLGRAAEAIAGFEQCLQLRPNDPKVLFALGFAEVYAQKIEQGALRIIHAIELDPTSASYIDPEQLATLQRRLAYVRATNLSDRLTDALAQAGWGRDNPAAFSAVTELAIRHRIEAGDKAGALDLLPNVIAPDPGVEMLIDRRYATLWPEIERWAGNDLSVQRRAVLEGATETYKTARTSTSRLAYVHALNDTGRTEDAIDELRRWVSEPVVEDDPYYHTQSIVILGRLLGEQGRRAEGIALMRAALTGADQKHKDSLNIVPNLVIQLLLAGDYQGATAILDQYTPTEANVEAPAALGYFVALRACALRGSGKIEASREAHDRVKTVYATNTDAIEIATTCVGTADDQAALWIETATDGSSRGAALVALETARYRAAQRLPARSSAETALRAIADRADVRAAFLKFGRPLPARYQPALTNFSGVPAEQIRHDADGPVA